MQLYEVREMMVKELHGALHDEFYAYLKKYDRIAGDDRSGIYDILLFYHHDPRGWLYTDIAKATGILCLFETTKKKRRAYKMQLSPTSWCSRKHFANL